MSIEAADNQETYSTDNDNQLSAEQIMSKLLDSEGGSEQKER